MDNVEEAFSRPYSVRETEKVAFLVHLSVLDHLARGVSVDDLEKISRINKNNDAVIRRSLEPKHMTLPTWYQNTQDPRLVAEANEELTQSAKREAVFAKKLRDEDLEKIQVKQVASNVIPLKYCESGLAEVK